MAALGMNRRAKMPPIEDTLQYCNGLGLMAARGMNQLGNWPTRVSDSGYARIDVLGLHGHNLNGEHMNSITSTSNPTVLPSAYNGYGNANKELPPLLKLPKEVLNLIVLELVKQKTSLIPLRFVCKRIANLPGVVQTEKDKKAAQIRKSISYAAENALGQGTISLVRWYHERLHYPLTSKSSAVAASGGNLAMLQWLREKRCPWDSGTCFDAAEGGHLEVLQWAHANGCPWNEWTCTAAAEGGHLEALQWARANGCPWTDRTCAYAASGGHLEVLQWARANGCPWDELTCTAAAANGYLGVLQWARANGCPWNESTCKNAAHRGHLTILQWARANGCPWDESTWKLAHESVRQWLRENRCPGATWP